MWMTYLILANKRIMTQRQFLNVRTTTSAKQRSKTAFMHRYIFCKIDEMKY